MVLGQDQVCAWFSLARLPTDAARKLFLYHSLKEMAFSFVFWLLEPVQCRPRQDFFVPYLLPSHVKYYPNSQNFPPFYKGRGKNSVMMTSIVRLSSNIS